MENAVSQPIGARLNRRRASSRWEIRLLATGLVGALAGAVYTTMPFLRNDKLPDEYLNWFDAAIGDVKPMTLDELAETVINSKGRDAQDRDRQ